MSLITSGLSEVVKQLESIAKVEEWAADVLNAGAEVVVKSWKDTAERHKHRRTGNMIDSIAATKPRERGFMEFASSVYPQGDGGNVTNAAKAAMLAYGTSRGVVGDGWTREAEDRCAEDALRAMQKALDDKAKN